MPTTLFVLINALINSVRMVDHIFVMTRGGPDNASTLLLYYLYEVGFSFWDTAYAAALTVVVLVLLGLRRAVPVRLPRAANALPLRRDEHLTARRSAAARVRRRAGLARARDRRGLAARPALDPAARLRGVDGVPPVGVLHPLRARRAADAAELRRAWQAAPFARYFLNTTLLVTMVLAAQLVLGTLAAYAFARFEFRGRDLVFALVLLQLMVMPDVLIVENYKTMNALGLRDTMLAIGLPYFASAFGIFLLRQTFKTVPRELDDAARVEGASALQMLLKVYVPLARPVYLAYALVSVSYHWNNFLWPLIITNSVETRPLTVGLQVFSSTDQGVDWSIITAATLMTSAPLLIGFLLFQRQFVQSFMRAGIR